MIETTMYSDPACPWAYSESPALRVIEWRYGDQLDWRLVLVGLTEAASQYAQRGYTPLRGALGQTMFRRRYGMKLGAGGFQPVEAYDVLVANLDPTLRRNPPPETPRPLLERFPDGLSTQEVAALMTEGNEAPDRAGAEAALLELVAGGAAV